ncbi:Uncharacterized protein Rs2_37127 [Raphanus sativus]|uniref:Uncharacterized protein LOC108819449 n=1 Tax=Raphanus sativus TaxID=3726 RepID=A0A6J0KK72_RAPSA|nr:uncharacterized protein LOC108819449 [Raphanus sativus]KAJ4880073.1 Uncharacterized protein Rs2_37127 [Raphanus sativus]
MSERQDTGDVSLSVKHEEDVSPESLAWADSCIISFPDDSDNNDWGTFRDALTEIIDIHPQIFVPTESTTSVRSQDEVMTEPESVQIPQAADSSSREQVSEIVSLLNFESDPSKNSLPDHYFPAENRTNHGPVDNHHTTGIESIEEDGSVSNGEADEEEPESETPQVFKDDFMSGYVEDNNNAEEVDILEDPDKLTPQEIFKVWDLKIVGEDDEEDGLVMQVKQALDESSTIQLPIVDDHVVVEKSYIDDLIAGITDLSLTETFE